MRIPFSKHILIAGFGCLLFDPALPAQASVPEKTTTITLDRAVHFIGTDGSDVVADPGDYSVEAAQEWLRLIPGTDRRDALLVEAQQGTYKDEKGELPIEFPMEFPIVVSTPGSEVDESDVHAVELINPDGTNMIAIGTYSGIRPRGLFPKLRNKFRNSRIRKALGANKPIVPGKLETSRRVPPTPIKIGEMIQFGDAGGWKKQVCSWNGDQLIPAYRYGCRSEVDLPEGLIRVVADRSGSGGMSQLPPFEAQAWVEVFKDFTVVPRSASDKQDSKMAIFNVPIYYHGKASSNMFKATAHYTIILTFSEISLDAGPVYKTIELKREVLENHTQKVGSISVKGIPIPINDSTLADRPDNPVVFTVPVIPGRIYRLTLRVEVKAFHVATPFSVLPFQSIGAETNFFDEYKRESDGQKERGHIKWGLAKVRINP